jgi:hypothetical protein
LQSSLPAHLLFFRKAELADRKAECCFLACAWQSTPQLPLQRIRAWRERMRGNRLAQAVYGKCSLVLPSRCNLFIVVSDPRSHHRRCGLDPTAVSPAPPFSQVFAFDPSRERRVRAVAPRTQRCPRSGEAVPWGFSAADAWKMASRYTWGSCDRATRGHFCLSLPQVRLLMLLLIGGYFAIKIGAVSRVRCGSRRWICRPRVKYADGPSTTPHGPDNCKEWSNVCLGQRRPRPDEGTVG